MSTFTRVRTSLGTLALGFSERGIHRVLLPQADWTVPTAAALTRAGMSVEAEPPAAIARVARALVAHVDGDAQDFSDAPLDSRAVPPFSWQVQQAALRIAPGTTKTYGELAALAGSANASRAAGRAMATNPWPIIVPCHRIFARSGFGEYSAGSGVATKLRLLWREGYRGRTSNVDFDEHAALAHLRAVDPLLAKVIARAGPFTLQATVKQSEPFVALADAIISQQLSGMAAATIYARVAALFGGGTIDDPAALLKTPKTTLREAGLSEAKALSLKDLAQHARDGAVPTRKQMHSLSDEAIIERLLPIRGIGRWSVQMLLMFYLGRPNVLPAADLGVQKGYQLVYHKRALPKARVLEKAASTWAPYASVASWYMWRAVDMNRYSIK